jgi:hypothetical protein
MSRFANWRKYGKGGGWVFFPVALFWLLLWDGVGLYDKLYNSMLQRGGSYRGVIG